jgi:hypothetical protein
MGMGEPLANFRNVMGAVTRINQEWGIGARKITISTVGLVKNIRKLMEPGMPQVRLAVSLHCATDEERTALLPANRRNGGLDGLMTTLRDYINATGRRITLEWALIEGKNDNIDTAQSLGQLIQRYSIRPDMIHVNVIPLNPTGGYQGRPTQRKKVNAFCACLENEFNIRCTPRLRRGIDIDAGCGQLKASVLKKSGESLVDVHEDSQEDDSDDDDGEVVSQDVLVHSSTQMNRQDATSSLFVVDENAVDFEEDDFADTVFESEWEQKEADRLLSLVKGTVIPSSLV